MPFEIHVLLIIIALLLLFSAFILWQQSAREIRLLGTAHMLACVMIFLFSILTTIGVISV